VTDSPSEERAIYLALAIVGAVLVCAAIAARGAADTGATLGAAFVLLALAGLAAPVLSRRRNPRT
jgi:hypothetical protein